VPAALGFAACDEARALQSCDLSRVAIKFRIRERRNRSDDVISIEAGLNECPKCILVLTPNFLSNEGWTKREYDSIFTREVVEKQKLILPVWHNVGRDDVFKYSMILADRVAAPWSLGVEEVGRRLMRALT
jgi:hypothetical protein